MYEGYSRWSHNKRKNGRYRKNKVTGIACLRANSEKNTNFRSSNNSGPNFFLSHKKSQTFTLFPNLAPTVNSLSKVNFVSIKKGSSRELGRSCPWYLSTGSGLQLQITTKWESLAREIQTGKLFSCR